MVEVYNEYQKLPQDAKDGIIKQFPFVGEIIRGKSPFKNTIDPFKNAINRW